jgi:hypothetical protein
MWYALVPPQNRSIDVSDNLRRYRAIKQALKQLYPHEPQGNLARHLETLAGLISGIVESKSTNLPHIASKVPDGNKVDSRVKRFTRWVSNDVIETEIYFLPYAQDLLASLVSRPIALVMDGSTVGRGCLALLVSVIYQKRALPLAWLVVKGRKGHFPETSHLALLEQVHPLIPAQAQVTFLGDGEFDGTALQATVEGYGWHYVCRTAKNIILCRADHEFAFETIPLEPGTQFSLPEVTLRHHDYGPVHAIGWWGEGYDEPIYLLTNFADVDEACGWYRKRARIETFFSDQKSRGFNLHKSHLSDPQRLARLMMAACLAYIWIIDLGARALRDEWRSLIHRTTRCDLSLFQLGLRLLDHLLNEGKRIPVSFQPST